jgi:DNA-binding NtrC family response regulator
MSEQTVLLVEDDEATAELERRTLTRGGFKVQLATRVEAAIQLLERQPFAAVLLDYQLPDGDPWAVVAAAQARSPRVPVIMVTAMGNEAVAAEVHRGVSAYVKKTDSLWDRLPNLVDRAAGLARTE